MLSHYFKTIYFPTPFDHGFNIVLYILAEASYNLNGMFESILAVVLLEHVIEL